MDHIRPDDARVIARQLRVALQAGGSGDGPRFSPVARTRITDAAIAMEVHGSQYELGEMGVLKLGRTVSDPDAV
ncbi:hypothetical protein [Williamsia maris]|uniref:Uncharacterized protein n=1 Tax=Williamsia maris TaxID=72806 RepID=A0ABT1HL68_9NOCA|nr:hypothetical protein [Williamsia maris]MCP2178680.1 hypothetical protein [Williamsia maris]